ncbi:protein suppressor of k(+) transport growth defect 1 [Nicotiana attenuata]|uniref:Protein suppressor of k(+) transport growth defect 1 n=1 Tax=Nicotiana attenuata TaxID=49451 RepID=A0A314KJF4_NICAT|nr:protein suppressor of k(+) transport growth defect 1 [Nicotiana attenuata]
MEAITKKFYEYLHRAKEIRMVLDLTEPSLNEGDAVVVIRPKDGEYGDDPEQSKLRTRLYSEITRNSLIWSKMYSDFKQKAIEYVNQAVQEDSGNYAKAFPLYRKRFRILQSPFKVREGHP